MKMLWTNIIALSLFMSFLQSCGAYADDADKLQKCDKAVAACELYIKDMSDEIAVQGNEIIALKKQRDEAIDEAAKASTSVLPPWVWMIGGALVGGLVVHELSR